MQLKRATESQREVVMEGDNEEDEVHEVAMVASVVYDEDDSEEIQPVKEKLNMELYNTTQKETYKEVHVSDELTEEQRNRVWNGKNHPVMYASRKLLAREQKYSTGEKECLAVMFTIEKFQRYLKGQEFIIETDHRPLQVLNGDNATNPRVMRWGLILQGYKYKMSYIPGKDNVLADYLSRQSQESETG